MASIRRMTACDLLSLNLTNLDPLTENYDLQFYLSYLMKWPSLFNVVEDRDGKIVGYSTLNPPSKYTELQDEDLLTQLHSQLWASLKRNTPLCASPNITRPGTGISPFLLSHPPGAV